MKYNITKEQELKYIYEVAKLFCDYFGWDKKKKENDNTNTNQAYCKIFKNFEIYESQILSCHDQKFWRGCWSFVRFE